jgi:hypothetical protein
MLLKDSYETTFAISIPILNSPRKKKFQAICIIIEKIKEIAKNSSCFSQW